MNFSLDNNSEYKPWESFLPPGPGGLVVCIVKSGLLVNEMTVVVSGNMVG